MSQVSLHEVAKSIEARLKDKPICDGRALIRRVSAEVVSGGIQVEVTIAGQAGEQSMTVSLAQDESAGQVMSVATQGSSQLDGPMPGLEPLHGAVRREVQRAFSEGVADQRLSH